MNNKAHLRPKDFDSNGDIIPMACKEENNDLISREALKKAIKDEFDLAIYNGNIMLMSKGSIVDRVLSYIDNAPTVERPKYILKVKSLTAEDKKRFQEEWNKSAGGLLAIPDNYEIIPVERSQGELAEKLKDRIEENICKRCPMKNNCVLCEISRVFQIITLTAEEQKGGMENGN